MNYQYTIYFASVIILLIVYLSYRIRYLREYPFEYTLKDLIIDVIILLCIGIPVLNTTLAAAVLLVTTCAIIVQFLEWSKNIVIWRKK